jgi:hypothetical protein
MAREIDQTIERLKTEIFAPLLIGPALPRAPYDTIEPTGSVGVEWELHCHHTICVNHIIDRGPHREIRRHLDRILPARFPFHPKMHFAAASASIQQTRWNKECSVRAHDDICLNCDRQGYIAFDCNIGERHCGVRFAGKRFAIEMPLERSRHGIFNQRGERRCFAERSGI